MVELAGGSASPSPTAFTQIPPQQGGVCRCCRCWSNRHAAPQETADAAIQHQGRSHRLNAALGQYLPLLGWCQAQMMLRHQIAARDACVDPGNASGIRCPAQQRLPTRLPLVEVTIVSTIRCRSRPQAHAHSKQHRPGLETWAKDQHAAGQAVPWYTDTFTGKTLDGPAMTRLLADIRAGKVKAVVVWRLDRLGRTAKGLTALFDELVALKVNFVSLKDGMDLDTLAGRLIVNVLASVAAYETEIRAERIAAGKAAKQAKIDAIIKAGGTPPPVNKGGRPKGIPNKVTPTVQTMIINQDEGRAEEGSCHRQEVELVEADGVRGAAPGLKSKALRSCADRNRSAKSWGLVPRPGPVDHTRPGLLDNAAVAKVGRGDLHAEACGLGDFVWDSGGRKIGGDGVVRTP
jgi:DNA invertase Pin-like site-specific DNA recombinase